MKKRQKKPEEGLPDWLGTYGDMVTLLLTFFIMLFSMATIEKAKFQEIAESFKGQFAYEGVGLPYAHEQGDSISDPLVESTSTARPTASLRVTPSATNANATTLPPDVTPSIPPQDTELDDVLRRLEQAIARYGLGDYVRVLLDGNEITLRIDSLVLFDSGSADVKKNGVSVLKTLGNIIKRLDKSIFVQGHTDNVPIKSAQFPSNWELSTKRATNVVIFLIDNCGIDPTTLTATGNGEFHPILPNTSEANRAKNRRIDIVIIR